MKLLYFSIITILLSSLVSCSDDSSGGVTDPFGSGNGQGSGTGNVTIAISFQSDQQGGGVFSGTPSVAVKLNKLTVSVPAQQYTESFQFDGTETAQANVAEAFLQYAAGSGIATGQQWTFQFEGTIAADGNAFNITSNFTIP